ncbi:uncharacterized protein LOC112539323 [Tetranychus urticae]|uniref:uncharacterized protein LOC112539323 n=1 Tax=Tetranychus urticae TaxID=32264 RepID=UPI000D647FBD|nr:uncharacterized protein LOC112539323 [Tetranychus urticae]
MLQLEKLCLDNFDSKIKEPEEEVPGLNFIIDCGLIPSSDSKPCFVPDCDGTMVLRNSHHSVLKKAFICNKRNCHNVNFGQNSCNCCFRALRMICYNVLNKNPIRIGGRGHIVEIDETMIHKLKYNRGRLTTDQANQVWLFGGIDRESRLCFAEIVETRDAKTLLSVLQKHVELGTIYSDGWAAYNCLSANGYYHDFVNHSENFLKPSDNNVHTQKIERTWKSFKEFLPKSSNGPNRQDYLIEWLYKSRFHSRNERSLNFLTTLEHLKNDPFSRDSFDSFDYENDPLMK